MGEVYIVLEKEAKGLLFSSLSFVDLEFFFLVDSFGLPELGY